MKALLFGAMLCFLSFWMHGQTSINCLVDKGIKEAVISAKNVPSDPTEKTQETTITSTYDQAGRLLTYFDSYEQIGQRNVYEQDRLTLFTTSYKQLPNHYLSEQYDSLMNVAPTVIDTSFVLEHDANNNIKRLKRRDGVEALFSYQGCNFESHTAVAYTGDTISQLLIGLNEGLVKRVVSSSYGEVYSVRVYYDYKFNKRGHWIQRTSKNYYETTYERRKLRYYRKQD
ncbi:MAG: hypothetical protein AAF598_09980 [Bacteroidota bacterium]